MGKPVRYIYGMRARGFSPGAQPEEGFITVHIMEGLEDL